MCHVVHNTTASRGVMMSSSILVLLSLLLLASIPESVVFGFSILDRRLLRPRTRIIKTNDQFPDACHMQYGDGADFDIGFIGQDSVDFGGATGSLPVCLIELASTTLVNAVQPDYSPLLADGLMGLCPGCSEDDGLNCSGHENDVISTLVRAGKFCVCVCIVSVELITVSFPLLSTITSTSLPSSGPFNV